MQLNCLSVLPLYKFPEKASPKMIHSFTRIINKRERQRFILETHRGRIITSISDDLLWNYVYRFIQPPEQLAEKEKKVQFQSKKSEPTSAPAPLVGTKRATIMGKEVIDSSSSKVINSLQAESAENPTSEQPKTITFDEIDFLCGIQE